jgi:hypothetical protein
MQGKTRGYAKGALAALIIAALVAGVPLSGGGGVYAAAETAGQAAENDAEKSEKKSKEKAAKKSIIPKKVTIRPISDSKSKTVIRWYYAEKSVKYQVWVKIDSGKWKRKITTTKKNYTYKKSGTGHIYYFKVRGVSKDGGLGKFSNVETTKPIKVKVTTVNNRIKATWNGDTGMKKYTVQLKEFYSRGLKNIKTTGATSLSFKRKYCTTYCIRILGRNGTSRKYSKVVTFDTGSNPALVYERLFPIPSFEKKVDGVKYDMARTDAIVFVGNDLWYLKSKPVKEGSYSPLVLSCIRDYATKGLKNSASPVRRMIRYADGSYYYGAHGSSITYVDGYFYIAACGSRKDGSTYPIIKVNSSGTVVGEYRIYGFQTPEDDKRVSTFSTIDFYGKNQDGMLRFICRDGKAPGNSSKYIRQRFTVGTLYEVDKALISEDVSFITPDMIIDDPKCNDISYDPATKKLYQSSFVYDNSSGDISRNWLFAYTLNEEQRAITETKYLRCDLSRTNSSETRFEVEGVDVAGGSIYLGVNTDGIEDGLFRVKNYGSAWK